MNKENSVYRWSPHPVEFYCHDELSNGWLLKLSGEAWNLAWMALEDPALKPAPRGFRTALRHSLKRTAKIGRTCLSMRQLLRSTGAGFPHIVVAAEWDEMPKLLLIDNDWKSRWIERAGQARGDHPFVLNRTIDDACVNVEAANILLKKFR